MTKPAATDTDYSRVPPQDTESEVALLGAMLIDNSIVDPVMTSIRSEYFYKDAHRIIFEAMQEVYNSGNEIDHLTISHHLRKQDKIEQIGGIVYLANLSKDVSSGYNYGYYTLSIIDKFVRREHIRIFSEGTNNCYDESTDVADIMSYLGGELIKVQEVFAGIKKARELKELANISLDNYFERKRLHLEGEIIGITSGLKKMDKMTGGWQRGDSILLAGRTSMGKTATSLHFALSAARDEKKVQFFSFEMNAERLADRIIIADSQVSADGFKYGTLLESDEKELDYALDRLSKIGIFIDDNSSQNIDQVFAKCRVAKKREQCDLVIIDYIGLIPSSEKRNVREQEVSEISKRIKKYAKELNVPVITLVQVNRALESTANNRPKLSHLRESGALEQDADIVMFVYRPEYYGTKTITIQKEHGAEDIDSEGKGILIVAKQRNGQIGDVLFEHSHGLNVIKDYNYGLPF